MNTSNKRVVIGIVAIILLVLASLAVAYAVNKGEYVRGEYGKKCYITGSQHGNIKYPIYYDTLAECLKSLGQ